MGFELLEASGIFFDTDCESESHVINLNDTWGWATADGEHVPDDEMPEVQRLFWTYGWCGILYWVSERRGGCRSEFHDVNRRIEFVRHEEQIRLGEPSSSKRAYLKVQYVIGKE